MGGVRYRGKSVFEVLQRRWALIVLTTCVCVVAAAVITVVTPPTYQATALLVVDQRATSPTADLNATISTGELLAAHYVKMASTKTVLDAVCAKAGGSCTFDTLKDQVSLNTVKGTDLLAVTVSDRNPDRAAQLANLVAAQLISEERQEIANALQPTNTYLDGQLSALAAQIKTTKNPAILSILQAQYSTLFANREATTEQQSRLDGDLSTVESAQVPSTPGNPDPKLYLPAGLGVGLIVGIVLALLVDWLDDRIYRSEDLSDATGAPLVISC